MKNNDYWKKRFEILEEAQMAKGEEYYKELDKQYRKAMNDIESQLTRWYGRIAENNEINMSQARKWLKGKELDEFKWTVEEYIQYGKKNAINPIWLKELENASARAHINRLEALKIQLQQTVESLYQGQNIGMTDALRRIYEDGYYHSAFEIQRGLNVGWAIPALDSARVTQMLSKPWTADGSNFSDRIWKAKGDLVNTLHTELTQSIIMGRAPDKAIKRIADKFNTSRSRAGRLVMTESAFFASASQRDCFNDLGVEKYEICATLDNRTSETCQELDGKVFKMSEYEPGLTAPPFHCWCRTTTIPSFDDNFGERIARDESGRQYYVSDDMKYNDWKREYIDNSHLRNGGNTITPITDASIGRVKKIEVEGFTDVQNIELQGQHKALLKHAKDYNNSNEVAYILNSNNPIELGDSNVLTFTDPNNLRLLTTGSNLFVMHNHPSNSSFSINDLYFFVKNDSIKYLSIVKNNGGIEILTKNSNYDRLELQRHVSRMISKNVKKDLDSEYDKVISKIINNYQGISYGKG